MSDEIRTPKGRVLQGREDAGRWGRRPFHVVQVGPRFGAYFATTDVAWFGTLPEALDWLDARADETVAALLPTGAIVVTEERVRELAVLLVREIGRGVAGAADSEDARPAIDRLLSALRAGAKS